MRWTKLEEKVGQTILEGWAKVGWRKMTEKKNMGRRRSDIEGGEEK